MTKQKTFYAIGTITPREQIQQLQGAIQKKQIKEEQVPRLKPVLKSIAGPTGDQVLAKAIAAGVYGGIVTMDREVLVEALARLVDAGRITSEQSAAALTSWDQQHAPAEKPDPVVPASDSWTLMGITMKKLWWILSGVGAALIIALVVKMIAKR